MKRKRLQCTNWEHVKLRLVSHSTSSLCFWEVHWNTNLLLLFVSRRDVAISEYKFWNVTVLQTGGLAFSASTSHFNQLARPEEKRLKKRCFLQVLRTLQDTLQHKCKLHQSSANIVLVLSHSYPNDTYPMSACPFTPPRRGADDMGCLHPCQVQINHTIK